MNGGIVLEKRLQHGDEISVGESVFMFLEKEESAEERAETGHCHDRIRRRHPSATTQVHPQDVLYLQPEQALKQLPATQHLDAT